MDTTTNFREWLASVELDGHEEVHSLYHAVRNNTQMGSFSVKSARGDEQWIVTALHVDQRLVLVSEHARQTFLEHLRSEHCGEAEMEEWLGYEQALAKQD